MSGRCCACGENGAITIDKLCVLCSWDAAVKADQVTKSPAREWEPCAGCGKRIPARCTIACPHCFITLSGAQP